MRRWLMDTERSRDYATQADYAEWVRESTEERLAIVVTSLRQAFGDVIQQETVDVIVFSGVTAESLANRIEAHPEILKPLLLATNIAARAIERDLGMRNVDTYKGRLSHEETLLIAAFLKPFLPDSLPLPSLAELDRVMFADKEIRKLKGQWEKTVVRHLNRYASVEFKKARFRHNDLQFELDAAATGPSGKVTHAVDIKRVEARRDIHKRTDEIVNKASHYKAAFPTGTFGAAIYYPIITEQGNVRDRLDSPHIDAVCFAGITEESIVSAVRLLLGKLGCQKV